MIFKTFGVIYSPRRVCELLKEFGFSFKRPRMSSVLCDEKEQKDFVETKLPSTYKSLSSLARENRKELKILCLDEASFRRDGTLHFGWFLKGIIPEIEDSNGRFESIKMFGSVDPLTGDFSLKRINGKMNKATYISYLVHLSKRYPDNELLILDDNAPWHSKANIIEDSLKSLGINNIHILRFPKYSPKMNPCEKLWKWLRDTVTHCRYYNTLSDLLDSVFRFYRRAYNKKSEAIRRFKTEIPIFKFIT